MRGSRHTSRGSSGTSRGSSGTSRGNGGPSPNLYPEGSLLNAPPPRTRPDLLPTELLSQLGGLEFLASRIADGFLLGLHRSARRGFSSEFAELRRYRPGDDLRHVDWRMVGRSDRFFVKQFEEETHLSAYLLLDASGSMGWTSRPGTLPTKLWVARHLAAAFGLLLLRQGDRVGVAPFDTRVRRWLPPRGGPGHRGPLLRALADLAPSGETTAGDPLREVALRLTRPGLVVLISDLLMQDEGPTLRALQFLAHRGHEVVVLHVMDPGERTLSGVGRARLRDPETGQSLRVSIPDLRADYEASVEAAIRAWRTSFRAQGIGYHLVDTEAPLGTSLRAMLEARRRR